MSKETETETETETEEEETETGITMGGIRDLIKETVTEILGSHETAKPTARRQSHNEKSDAIAAEVEAALAKVGKEKEEAEAKKADADWKAQVNERLAEKPPVARRKIHKVMGWGE